MDEFVNNFNDFGITIPNGTKADHKGNVYVICPQCEPIRRKKGEKKLSVHTERGVWNCHHCGWHGNLTTRGFAKNRDTVESVHGLGDLPDGMKKYMLEERGISEKTLNACEVKSAVRNIRQENGVFVSKTCMAFPYRYNGLVLMVKYRDNMKNFSMETKGEMIPWGLDWIHNEEECFIVEGEIDRLSMHEVGLYNTVSVPAGTTISKAEKEQFQRTGKLTVENHLNLSYFDECYETFKDKKIIYIATDDDAPGVKLRLEIARRFGMERCRFIRWSNWKYKLENGEEKPCKDANDILVHIGKEVLANCKDDFEIFPIEDVITIDDSWPDILSNYEYGHNRGKTTGFMSLDPHFNWRFGHTVVINGYPNNGKTVFGWNLILLSALLYDWRWAAYCPENYPVSDLYAMMIEMLSNKTMDLDGVKRVDLQDMDNARKFIRSHVHLVDRKDGYSPENLRELTRQLIMQYGIVGMYKDPWNALTHELNGLSLDMYLERELSAEVRLSVHNNIINLIAVHPPTPKGDDRKNPSAPSMFEITGGGAWSKKIYDMLCVHIHNKADLKDTSTEIHVQKTKWHKLVGIPTYDNPVFLNFSRVSQRFHEGARDPFTSVADRYIPQSQINMEF